MADEQTKDNVFNADDTVAIYVPKDDKRVAADPIRLNVNGHTATIKLGTDVTIPRFFLPALADAGIPYRFGPGGSGGEGGAPEGSGATLIESSDITSNNAHHDAEREGKPPEDVDQVGKEDATDKGDDSDGNDDDSLVAGTVADVTGKLDGADAATLDQYEKAEKDREQPRTGVLAAIDKARAKLAE